MNNFVTHTSIRLKGTEHVYEPVFCCDAQCEKRYVIHMHCPFCVRTESFTDPVILKAHYRVKHVDKGIDFGGLKIIRCCDHCDIVGSIKGSKEIKGAHWHCYRCRNGFNRRDEALKHYRTHFRTPETTFQIHIPQDVNQAFLTVTASGELVSQSGQEATTTSVNIDRVDGIVTANDDRCLQVSVAANETVDTTTTVDIPEVLVLPPSSSIASIVRVNGGQEMGGNSSLAEIWSPQDPCLRENLVLEADDKQQVVKNESSSEQLQIKDLQLQVQKQAAEIEALKKREAELIRQLEMDLDDNLSELLERMKAEHEALLRQQLLNLRTEYLRHLAPSPSTIPNRGRALAQPMFILNGSPGQPFQIIRTIKLQSSSVAPCSNTFTSDSELLSSILPGHNADVPENSTDGEKAEERLDGSEQDCVESEAVPDYIVTADDISEYVDTEDCVGDNPDAPSEDVVCSLEDVNVINVSRKRLTDQSESGILLKRERI